MVKIVAGGTEGFDEAEFADVVQRNLERGRAVIAVVGDGVREGVVQLADLVQGHAGHRFTFALVELALFETPMAGVRLVVPSVLARTKLIERGVVRIEGGAPAGLRVIVDPVPPDRPMSVGEDEFFETLGQKYPVLPKLLKDFLGKAEALGVYPELLGGLNHKHASPTGRPVNMGTIFRNGIMDIWGIRPAEKTYTENLAKLIGGSAAVMKNGSLGARTAAGGMPRLWHLLPEHEQPWLDAMEQCIRDCTVASPADNSLKASA
jgi:hypothetical protein